MLLLMSNSGLVAGRAKQWVARDLCCCSNSRWGLPNSMNGGNFTKQTNLLFFSQLSVFLSSVITHRFFSPSVSPLCVNSYIVICQRYKIICKLGGGCSVSDGMGLCVLIPRKKGWEWRENVRLIHPIK